MLVDMECGKMRPSNNVILDELGLIG